MRSAPPALFRWLAMGLIAGPSGGVAHAETSPYTIGLSQSLVSDSNLLRLDGGGVAPAGLSKSDLTSITSLFATLDQPFGRQRLLGNVTLRAQRMAQNDIYDFNGYTVRGGIDWSTIEKLSGTLILASNRSLARLNDTSISNLPIRNIETTRQIDATARLGLAGRFGVELGFAGHDVAYSADEFAAREFSQQSVSAGLRYRPSGASSFAAGARLTRGKYPQFQTRADGSFEADRFDRRDLDLTARVEPSGASAFDVRLSLSRTDYERAAQRDFSGLTGAASWSWRPTGKLRFNTALSRDSGQESSFATPDGLDSGIDFSRLTTALSLRADYELSAKVGLNSQLAVARRSLARTSATAATSDSDTTVTLALGGSWLPTRSIQLSCDLSSETRRANGVQSSSYRGSTFGCRGQITLQ